MLITTRMSALVLSIRCRLAQIQELVRIRTVGEPGVGGWWRGTENVIGHAAPILPGMTYSYLRASIGSRLAARMAGTIPLMIPTTARMPVEISRIIGETTSRISPASACFAIAL